SSSESGLEPGRFSKAKIGERALLSPRCTPYEAGSTYLSSAWRTLTYLPDSNPVFRRDKHFIARLHLKCVIPAVDIPGRTNHPELTERMRIARHLLAHIIIGNFATPCLGPTQKNALLASEPVEHRRRFSSKRSLIGIEREREPSQIRNIFAHGYFAIYSHARQRFILRILLAQNLGARLESLCILRQPPIAQRPRGIDFAPLIVEAVGQFVPDNATGGAVVDRRIGIGIEDRRLQNSGGKNDVAQ